MQALTATRSFRRPFTWSGVFAMMLLLFFIDGQYVAERVPHNQWIANAVMAVYFMLIYRDAPLRIKRLMVYGIFVGTAGEVIFSLFVGMYEYRLENVPLYVPPGHAILYACVYYFVREPWVLRNQKWLIPSLIGVGLGYSALWLVTRNDVFGAVCTVAFGYFLWRHPSSRLFFAAMFLYVAFLELAGTGFGCWYWHQDLVGRFSWMPCANPPAGCAVFYFGFDAGCLDIYALRHRNVSQRYARYRDYLAGRKAKASEQGLVPA